jgi:Ser/Thr protein kinase RdoA (MazF antagonist)
VDPIDAAMAVARQLGLRAVSAVTLRDTNNVVLWLAPTAVVVKISTRGRGRLAEELRIAEYLASVGAPVVGPAREVPRRVHRVDRFDMTFWRYEPQHGADISAQRLASALHQLHDALADMPSSVARDLPSYREEVDAARQVLADPSALAILEVNDREMLGEVLDDTHEPTLATLHTLHGAPHRLNVLVVDGEPRFIDFETVCLGPLEWDLAHLEDDVARHYPNALDSDTLRRCRTLVSATTAVWCWEQAAQNPQMRWHAEYHLNVVREATQ